MQAEDLQHQQLGCFLVRRQFLERNEMSHFTKSVDYGAYDSVPT